jgi:hypothetical protein
MQIKDLFNVTQYFIIAVDQDLPSVKDWQATTCVSACVEEGLTLSFDARVHASNDLANEEVAESRWHQMIPTRPSSGRYDRGARRLSRQMTLSCVRRPDLSRRGRASR